MVVGETRNGKKMNIEWPSLSFLNRFTGDYDRMENDELFRIYAQDKTNIIIRNVIVENNMPLVQSIVNKMIETENDRDDCVSIASLYLIKAVERFDHTLGYKFSSYASCYIEGAVKVYFSETAGRGSRGTGEQIIKIRRFESESYMKSGKMPTNKEIKKVTRKTQNSLDSYYARTSATVPFIQTGADGDNYEVVGETFPDPAETLGVTEMVKMGLRFIHPVYREAVCAYYLDGLDLAEVASMTGISRERARQIIQHGLTRMRRYFERKGITIDG